MGPGEALLLASSSLLNWLLLALEMVTFPVEVQVRDGLPLGAAPPRRIQELVPVAGLIIPPDLLNQGHKICFRVISGPPIHQEFLDHPFNEVLLTAAEGFSLLKRR